MNDQGRWPKGGFLRIDARHNGGFDGQVRRILIIHQNFPGQFRHIARQLHGRSDVKVVGLGCDTAPGLASFPWFKYKSPRPVAAHTHPYLRQMEDAVLHGQAAARAMQTLKRKGFEPNIILAHPGWGETLYAKDIFPAARLIHFCEWYYGTHGADFGFDPEFPQSLDDRLRVTTWNALHLLTLQQCDEAISPTHWQKSRYPETYQRKIQVIHEGIDTNNLRPDACAKLALPNGDVLQAGDPVVTYVARNLEPYRGFHQFMRALPEVLRAHNSAQVVIVGGNGRGYGALPKDAPHWQAKLLQELRTGYGPEADGWLKRIHFLGKVPYEVYKSVLQISAAHVYLTYPFVLSWSLLEAMACACHILASDTAPVREVIQHNHNGILFDFFDQNTLSQQILSALRHPETGSALRERARHNVQQYSLKAGLKAYGEMLGLAQLDEQFV